MLPTDARSLLENSSIFPKVRRTDGFLSVVRMGASQADESFAKGEDSCVPLMRSIYDTSTPESELEMKMLGEALTIQTG